MKTKTVSQNILIILCLATALGAVAGCGPAPRSSTRSRNKTAPNVALPGAVGAGTYETRTPTKPPAVAP